MTNKRSDSDRRAADGRRLGSDRRDKDVPIDVDQRSDFDRRFDDNRRAGMERRGLDDIFTEES